MSTKNVSPSVSHIEELLSTPVLKITLTEEDGEKLLEILESSNSDKNIKKSSE